MTDTIMLEAPARGGRISDLADGQGRILRLHDLTASSLGHASHANPDRKPINVANQTESPTCTGGRVTIERKPDEGDGPAVIHRLNDERDQRWQNLIAGFLVHASRGVVRHDGQHEYTAVLCGPQAAMPFDLGTDTHTPTLGQHRDPLDHGGPYGKELCCITVPGSGIICGILQVWHDERASYKAVLGPRPYKRRPEQVIRIGQRFWQLLIPAFSDLFGEQIPDHIHLHLVIRDSEAQRTIRFIQPDGRNDRELVRIIRPTLGDATEQILQSFEQSHGDVMLQTGSWNKNTTNKAGTIPLIPGDHHTDPTIFTHCIKAVGSRHYVDGWSLSDAHGRRVRYTDLPERIPTGILRGTVLQCGDCGGGMEHPTL